VAIRASTDRATGQECVADEGRCAWHRLWSEPPRLRDQLKLGSWLLSVAANEARQQLRRRRVGVVRELRSPGEPASTDPAVGIDRLDLMVDFDGALALGWPRKAA